MSAVIDVPGLWYSMVVIVSYVGTAEMLKGKCSLKRILKGTLATTQW